MSGRAACASQVPTAARKIEELTKRVCSCGRPHRFRSSIPYVGVAIAVQFFGVAILPLRVGWQNRRHRASCTGNAGAAESAEETEQSPNRLHIHAGLASLYAKKCAICITNVASAIFSHQMQHPLYPTAISGRTFAALKPLNEKHPIWKKDF